MPKRSTKNLKSARVDEPQLRRVRRFLGAKTDSQAIAMAIAHVDEERILPEWLATHAGGLAPTDWHEIAGT